MLSSPPLPTPHWNLNDPLSNHRTKKSPGHKLTCYDVETEVQRSPPFLHAIPKCLVILCTGLGPGTSRHQALPGPRAETHSQGKARQCKGFKILGSLLLGQPNDRQAESFTKDLEDKRQFPFSAFAQTAPPTGTPALSLSLSLPLGKLIL